MQFVVSVGARAHEPFGKRWNDGAILGGGCADSRWQPHSAARWVVVAGPAHRSPQPHTLERAGFREGVLHPSKAVV